MTGSWKEFYQSDFQAVYALWVVPLAFFVYWLLGRQGHRGGVEPRAVAFINAYAPIFTIETIIDPYTTGPLLRALDVQEPLATGVMLLFVLLGDFRVYLLLFFVLAPERGLVAAIGRAAAWTLVVPVLAWSVTAAIQAYSGERPLPGQTIWIAYEIGFVVVISIVVFRVLPSAARDPKRFEVHEYLRALARFVMGYYALWASADLLILFGGLDAGWGLRAIPNQLYYSFWIPFAYGSFFSARYAPASRPTQRMR